MKVVAIHAPALERFIYAFSALLIGITMLVANAQADVVDQLVSPTERRAWRLYAAAPAVAQLAKDGDTLRATIAKIGRPRDVQIFQPNIDLVEGREYTVHFEAKATSAQQVQVDVGCDRPDWHGVGLSEPVQVTTEWKSFDLIFTAIDVESQHSRLRFSCGDALGNVGFRSISLTGPTTEPPALDPAAPEILKSADNRFWSLGEHLGGSGTLTTKDATLNVSVTKTSKEPWGVQLVYELPELIDGKEYLLSFEVKAEPKRVFAIVAQEQGGKFEILGLDRIVEATSTWKTRRLVFKAARPKLAARLAIHLGDTEGLISIKQLSLRPVKRPAATLDNLGVARNWGRSVKILVGTSCGHLSVIGTQ